MLDPKTWKEELLKQYSADMSQFIGAREYILNGQRALHLYNAVGLEFIVLPDRGFDIWDARYKGIPLTWLAPGSPHPPDWGAGWLRGFNGGLMTTCGLTHVGPAEIDNLTGERSDIHGAYTRQRAGSVQTRVTWVPNEKIGDSECEIHASALVRDSSFFGAQLRLERRYNLGLAAPGIGIADVVTNVGDTPAPLMLLYHFNLGFPLVREGVKLHTSGQAYPRDAAARAGIATRDTYHAPSAGYPEQVFYHHLDCDDLGTTRVIIGDDTLALMLMWQSDVLPYFTQWKNTRQSQYVNGIEPGNCIPEGRNAAREAGRLRMLQPGESVETWLSLAIFDSPEHIASWISRFAEEASRPIPGCNLSDYASLKE